MIKHCPLHPTRQADEVAPYVRHRGSISRAMRNPHFPLLLLLLVGLLRSFDAGNEGAHEDVTGGHQLLGRGHCRPSLLAHLLPVRRDQTTYHDRPVGRRAGRRPKTLPSVARRRGSCRAGRGVEGLLAGISSVLLKGIPGERDGAGCL